MTLDGGDPREGRARARGCADVARPRADGIEMAKQAYVWRDELAAAKEALEFYGPGQAWRERTRERKTPISRAKSR